ncbi:hypothetical protein ERJ70_05505 [Sediminibacillus dalangtanensis]|uniref:DUF3953 domain-containing protein n=1 Tax=Sediminibacillus dalangtanensis TaxID=2729421 RepID=A0ABX7VSL8_9BACI|nr:hypothetical protein [Sediminibacillus dalangtanensis]QTM98800.1 hypothetical protein ERJ70_05505 [Sediminibacillus dalangtanensis]
MKFKAVRIMFILIVIGSSGVNLLAGDSDLLPYTMLAGAALLLLNGMSELNRSNPTNWGYMSLAVSLFLLIVSIEGFLS